MNRYLTMAGLTAALLGSASGASADAFSEYGTNSKVYTFSLPTIAGGWGVAVDGFPDTGTTKVSSVYELRGRLLVATDTKLYLQKNYGSSQWVIVANTGTTTMDPGFLEISPDGTRIALGLGYGQQLLFFNASLLSSASPPNLLTASGVTKVTANYYSGAWKGNNVFFFNGGANVGGVYSSGILGVTLASSGAPTVSAGPYNGITSIPGASAGIGFDASGNLVSGIGYLTSPTNRTGELRVWSAANTGTIVSTSGSTTYAYSAGTLLANNILSADALGFDADGNLHIGGGDAFGSGGAAENGYAAVVKYSTFSGILTGGSVVNEASSAQYKQLTPDPCKDDSATSPITVVPWSKALTIAWNPSGNESSSPAGQCYTANSAQDYWEPGVTPKITQYYPTAAPDSDSDGIPNGSDNAYLTANANQRDTDGDGWGNNADCDLNNDGQVTAADQTILTAAKTTYSAHADFDGDGLVNAADQTIFNARLGTFAPFY